MEIQVLLVELLHFVFFLSPNHTEGTNREKKDLFVVAVRSAGGDTLPVNLTVIPSGQKWVFDTIY